MALFSDLPTELIQQILGHLRPLSLYCFSQTSKTSQTQVTPLLWRNLCICEFQYWPEEDGLHSKLLAPVDSIDWKAILVRRLNEDRFVEQTLSSILATQSGRIRKIESILRLGYSVKDCLLRSYNANHTDEDVLAKRFYSKAILGCLHRHLAIKEWLECRDTDMIAFERVMVAFDVFVMHDVQLDFDKISSQLDSITSSIKGSFDTVIETNPRALSLAAIQYLRSHNLTGVREDARYHDLRNNFIGVALQDDDHSSLPLISSTILCCVLHRLSLSAYPCGLPNHVITMVKSRPNFDLDGNLIDSSSGEIFILLDPFQSSQELSRTEVEDQMRMQGFNPAAYLKITHSPPVRELALRCARNIIRSVQEAHRRNQLAQMMQTGLHQDEEPSPDLQCAFYAALWASMALHQELSNTGSIMGGVVSEDRIQRVVDYVEMHYPMDVSLLERYINPSILSYGPRTHLTSAISSIRDEDDYTKPPKYRTRDMIGKVKYKVGQVFHHCRHDYTALITGWDTECSATETWVTRMRVHELKHGRFQSFYHALVEDQSVRYVAQENIEIITPNDPGPLLKIAGKHFKRWDSLTHSFVSNIRDEYPDD